MLTLLPPSAAVTWGRSVPPPDMMLFGLLLQTAAEELINGLEEYIVESFVRLILHTHQPVYSSLITTINQPWLAGPGDGLWVLSVHIPTIKLLSLTC